MMQKQHFQMLTMIASRSRWYIRGEITLIMVQAVHTKVHTQDLFQNFSTENCIAALTATCPAETRSMQTPKIQQTYAQQKKNTK